MVVRDMGMGWVDYDFGHSTVSQVVLRQMGVWQNRLGNSARWWNIPNKGHYSTFFGATVLREVLHICPYSSLLVVVTKNEE